MSIRFVLGLLRYRTFFQAKGPNGRVASGRLFLLFIRLFGPSSHFHFFFVYMFNFNAQPFRWRGVGDCRNNTFGARNFKTVKRNVNGVHADPIRRERGVMDGSVSTTLSRIARAFFVVLSMFPGITDLNFSVFICQSALCCQPFRISEFSRFLSFRGFFSNPRFAIKGIIWDIGGAHDSNLFGVPGTSEVIQSMPAPNLFKWGRFIF